MSASPSYYARRYRTLYSPDALNFTARPQRPAIAAVYSPAPTGVHCGLPKAARATKNPGLLLTILAPIAIATGIVTYLEGRITKDAPILPQETLTPEEARRKELLDAYGDRESLDRLEQVMAVYEATH